MYRTTIALFFVLASIILITILVGVYVYKDAAHRGMNAALWAIVSMFTPYLIGLVIYLLVRGSNSDLTCSNCGEPVTSDFVVCPRCGVKLKSICLTCSYPCESTWTVCPKCASDLTEKPLDIMPPIKKKDKILGKILIMVIVIPVLLFIGLCVLSLSMYTSNKGSTGLTFMPVEEYIEEINSPKITQWVESCSSEKKMVYALRYKGEENGQKITNYVIYFPFEFFDNITSTTESRFFKQYVKVEFGGNPNNSFVNTKYNFLQLSTKNDRSFLDLKATYNEKNVPCIVVDVEYNPINIHVD